MRVLMSVVTLSMLATAMPSAAQQPPRGTLTRTLELVGTDFPYEFTRISALIPLADGSIIIAEPREQRLRRLADEGGTVRSIGRAGAGPGEFRLLAQVGAFGDTLWATDVGTRRTTLFDVQGRVLTTFVWDLPSADPGETRNVILGYFSASAAWGEPSSSPATIGDERAARQLSTLSADGRTRVGALTEVAAAHARFRINDGGTITFGAQPFADAPLVIGRGAAGIVVVDRRTDVAVAARAFAVTAISPRGDTLWRRLVPFAPRRIRPAVRDSVIGKLQRGTRFSRAAVEAALHLPAHWPPVADAFVSVEGAVWIRTEQDQAEVRYLRLRPTGEIEREVMVPRAVRLIAARGDTVWALRTDEDDVPSIERYSLSSGTTRP